MWMDSLPERNFFLYRWLLQLGAVVFPLFCWSLFPSPLVSMLASSSTFVPKCCVHISFCYDIPSSHALLVLRTGFPFMFFGFPFHNLRYKLGTIDFLRRFFLLPSNFHYLVVYFGLENFRLLGSYLRGTYCAGTYDIMYMMYTICIMYG